MFIVDSYALAVVFCFVTMLYWAPRATPRNGRKTWRYELFYWDYVIMFLFALIASLTMGASVPKAGRSCKI